MTAGRPIVLVGPMGTGKSTVGRLLAAELGCHYFDNDAEMSVRYGFTQEQLATMPVEQLHELESRYLRDVLAEQPPFVTGVAGSVVESEQNRELLRRAFTVYLYLPETALQARAGAHGVGRQALRDAGAPALRELLRRRDPLYREVAQLEVRDRRSPQADVAQILDALAHLTDHDRTTREDATP